MTVAALYDMGRYNQSYYDFIPAESITLSEQTYTINSSEQVYTITPSETERVEET